MTAGRGIVHLEMPESEEECTGLQLWVNLAGKNKMIPPHYQELEASEIASASQNGVSVRVIAGSSLGVQSSIKTLTPMFYLEFHLDPNAQHTQDVESEWNSFLYVLSGSVYIGNSTKAVTAHHTVILTKGNAVTIRATYEAVAHFVLLAGQPINEPVVAYGPFVMNTQSEINQAMADYRNQRNGFENAHSWQHN